jgi:isopentenyl phosphate kinase
MSTRYNNGSHYENHQRAAELHDLAAHAHRSGEQQGKAEHLTGNEQTRIALEHSETAFRKTREVTVGHGVGAFGHDETAALAHELWQARDGRGGSADQDWFEAVKELRARAIAG